MINPPPTHKVIALPVVMRIVDVLTGLSPDLVQAIMKSPATSLPPGADSAPKEPTAE